VPGGGLAGDGHRSPRVWLSWQTQATRRAAAAHVARMKTLQAHPAVAARKVSCFLRGSLAPYPRRLRQGTLYLSALNVYWEPFWRVRRIPQQITGPFLSITTRPADDREPNVKKGGGSILNVPSFAVVTCHTPHGAVDLVVPDADARLVAGYFKPTSTGDRIRRTE
jgi:hypothetical protein